jgi:transmembrane sensor
MDKSLERYEALAEKWLNGTISPEEKKEFALWYNSFPDSPLEVPASLASTEEQHRKKLYSKIIRRRRSRLLPAAAAILLLIGFTSWLLWKMSWLQHPTETGHTKKKALPETGSQTILTLDDGHQVSLDALSKGDVIVQQGATIIKLDSCLLLYSNNGVSDFRKSSQGFNVLTTGKRGIFKVQFPDGTKVWLNSATSLTYPTVFPGTTREVQLSGQAYFEVAQKKDQPFIVKTQKVNVKVIGTSFDMMTYTDEDQVRTTLAQGAVFVLSNTSSLSPPSIVIHPGQQAILDSGATRFNVTEPDLDEVLAWREGKFRFSNENIKAVMRQITRWYDISIEYDGDVSAVNLTGSISRKQHVEDLLKAFETMGGIHFKLEGKKIIVIPINNHQTKTLPMKTNS